MKKWQKETKDLKENLILRAKIHNSTIRSPYHQRAAWELCVKDIIKFFDIFLWTYDPRLKPADRPFILWDYQEDYVRKINHHIERGIDLFTEKSRDMGVTWMTLGVFLYRWLFYNENFLVGSRKEELVDTLGEIESHFERLRYFMKQLPYYFLKLGNYDTKDKAYMKIYKGNGASIVGESMNENFSRQGRYNCLMGDTMVLTSLGWLALSECMEQEIENFIGVDGGIRKVKRYIKNMPERLIKITTKYGFQITGTSNHRMITDKGEKYLKDITTDDTIISKMTDYFPPFELCTENEAEVMGFLVSEGAVSSRAQIGFCQKDKDIMLRYIDTFNKAFEVSPFLREVNRTFPDGRKKSWMVAERSLISIRERLADLGLARVKADKKRIPYSVFSSSKKIQRAFLRALFEGDGSVSIFNSTKQLRVSYTTKSKLLARDVQMMLFSFGIRAGVKEEVRKDRKYVMYQLQMDCNQAKKFCEEIGFISGKKNNIHKNYVVNNRYLNHPCNPSVKEIGLAVRKIENISETITYDVELDKDHLFIANGLVSHNSVLLDEFAFVERGEIIWRACSDSTKCRLPVSTPNGSHNYFARLRKSGKIEVLTLHWKKHPFKTDEWYKREGARRSVKDIAQELDINYTVSAGQPFYAGFIRGVHSRQININTHKELVLGWDYGWHHPCCVVTQIDAKGRWCILDCVFGERELIEEFGVRVREFLNRNYPGYPIISYGDPAGNQENDKSRKTSVDILADLGFNVYSRPSNTSETNYAARKMIIEGKLKRIIDGVPELIVNDIPRTQIIIEAFEGGWHYPEANKHGFVLDKPVKDSYFEHPTNCIDYIAVNLFSAVKEKETYSEPVARVKGDLKDIEWEVEEEGKYSGDYIRAVGYR